MKRRTSSPSSSTGGSPSSDFGIMASGSAEGPAAPESSDASEECPGKKKSRFQTFKNFFAKKKRKEAAGPVPESEVQLKSTQSIEDVNAAEPTSIHTDKDSDSSSNINVGSKALSQDSVFTSDPPSPETIEVLQTSHDSIHNKVKSLQMQLKQAIRLGSPPAVISVKKSEDGEVVSEDDGLPCSPPEYSTIHTVLATSSQRSSGVVQRSGSLSLEGSDSDDDQMSGASSRPVTPLASIPVDFSEPASALSCLDCSAAHHRIAVKSRACAKRKPASREMLQTKRRDLRERILLRDTEDKLRAARTSTEEEEMKDNASKDDEEISELQEDSVISPSVLVQNEEELPESSQSQRSSTTSNSAEASEDDECVPDKDHIAMSGILESSWEKTVTLKLQTDDFLLDEGCEVVSEAQGSLLEEVLSSLKGPLVSGLVLESEATVEQTEVEDTAEEDVLDNLDLNDTTEHLDSTDPSSVLDDQLPFENTLSESVTLLQEVENVLQEEKVPERQEFAEDVPFDEDLQLHEGCIEREEYEVEEDQDDRKDLKEEVAEDGEKMDCSGEEEVMEQEDEDTKMEENIDKEEKHEREEDADKEVDQEEEMLVEDNKEDEDGEELNEEEVEDENETKDQSCPLEDEEQETESDTSIKIESFHETDQSASVSTEVVNQPEDLLAQECTEQPPFVVMTCLELNFPKKSSNQTKETEYGPEILQEDANEQHELLEECEDQSTESLQIDDESSELHQEEVRSERPQSSSSESEAAKESIQEVSPSATDDPVFKSRSRDQSSDSMRAEPCLIQVETPSLPSSPLQREICQADEVTTPENPFGVRLRKTPVLHRYASEGESPPPSTEPMETPKSPFSEQLSRKPALPKKPDQAADGVVKPKRSSDVAGKASVESSESPSWISLARQKQKVFKENSLDESPESKFPTQDEFNQKRLTDDPSGPVPKDQLKPVASPVKVSCSLEISKPVLVEKEKRTISHPVPAPLTQDEPPWLALAKKKAKAWSEMPQIVQ